MSLSVDMLGLGGDNAPREFLEAGRFDRALAEASARVAEKLAAGGTVAHALVDLAGENITLRADLAAALERNAGLERALHGAVRDV